MTFGGGIRLLKGAESVCMRDPQTRCQLSGPESIMASKKQKAMAQNKFNNDFAEYLDAQNGGEDYSVVCNKNQLLYDKQDTAELEDNETMQRG